MRAVLLALSLVACGSSPAPGSSTPTPTPAPSTAPSTTTPPTPGPTTIDVLETSAGRVEVHPVHHGTVYFKIGEKVVWVDPWSKVPLDGPKADVVLITDIHKDHFDEPGLAAVRKPEATVVAPAVVAEEVPGAVALANGESKDLGFMRVEAIPMYNLERGPEAGKLYHDRGRGNGYVLTVGDRRIYLSGDTECTPEMKALKDIDLAFVCMNLPYTMTPAEAAGCVAAFKPKVLYPYHYRDSNLDDLDAPLAGTGVEVRKRRWY